MAIVHVIESMLRGNPFGGAGGGGGEETDFTNAIIIFDGNSLTNSGLEGGYGAGPKYPEAVQAMAPWTTNGATFYNFGVGGQTTQAMINDATTQIDPLFDADVTCVVVAWEIGNDIHFNGDATAAFNRFKSYCQARQTVGFKVVVLNVTPRDLSPDLTPAGDTYAQWWTKAQAANALLAAQWTDFADAFVDLAADSRLDDPLDTTYYFDKVHHNGTGRGVIAQLVNPEILSL